MLVLFTDIDSPFFPDYQYLLVCSHQSLGNTEEAGMKRLQQLHDSSRNQPTVPSCVPFPKLTMNITATSMELLVTLLTFGLIKQTGILH